MKRSFINKKIDEIHHIITQKQLYLPTFAYFTLSQWRQQDLDQWQEVIDLQLGWDLTDFGSNNFAQTGLTLFTLRNGSLSDKKYPKRYAEKMLIIEPKQKTPMHFHSHKMEDIINRGDGDFCLQLFQATKSGDLDHHQPIKVSIDGKQCLLAAGETIILKPGQSICLPQRLYHCFWAEQQTVLGWEISMVNDDHQDNHFHTPLNRFSQIEEDEPIKWLLCNEYHLLNR